MNTKKLLHIVFIFCLFMFVSYSALANNISVSNFRLVGQNITNHYTMVKFDITWENSWRNSSSPNNWDAAWVFVKYRVGSGAYQHAWLNNTGHINPIGSTITTGLLEPDSTFNATTNPGLGVFIFRDADGTGTFSKTAVKLRWNYGANGLSDTARIDIRVYAIEHVYVPTGAFSAGSGGSESNGFTLTTINTGNATTTPTGTGTLGGEAGGYPTGQTAPDNATWPNGFNAFYCMKYEISQQGYVDFLNNLTTTQATNRFPNYNGSHRHAISVSSGVYSTTNPFVACTYICWADVAAYLDWSGLRPMTELEYEKSCRGTLLPVPNEFAWGTTGIANSEYTLINSGADNEVIATGYSTTVGNAAYDVTTPYIGSINGPVRVGIFAGNSLNTGRVTAGATYYGIMEMSGNLWERPVTVGNSTGRAFTGTHGNGLLDATGNANVSTWPAMNALGAGIRGGCWGGSSALQVSSRNNATGIYNGPDLNIGGRGVRSMP
ncbi:MAG: SUMF1/EgtB/PvdO family nonheme iron enzyme [Ignavibacteriae bacterium]|nr:SUMF1/EgtB/PvdO family nonheme iron enzyme [Ignavibacteriota bacterium]